MSYYEGSFGELVATMRKVARDAASAYKELIEIIERDENAKHLLSQSERAGFEAVVAREEELFKLMHENKDKISPLLSVSSESESKPSCKESYDKLLYHIRTVIVFAYSHKLKMQSRILAHKGLPEMLDLNISVVSRDGTTLFPIAACTIAKDKISGPNNQLRFYLIKPPKSTLTIAIKTSEFKKDGNYDHLANWLEAIKKDAQSFKSTFLDLFNSDKRSKCFIFHSKSDQLQRDVLLLTSYKTLLVKKERYTEASTSQTETQKVISDFLLNVTNQEIAAIEKSAFEARARARAIMVHLL